MTEAFLAIQNQLIQSFRDMALGLVEGAPRVITVVFLIAVLLVVAKVIERVLRRVFKRVHLDTLFATLGFDQSLKELGVKQSPSETLARVAYYLLLLLLARAVVDALGIAVISEAMGTFLGYIPNLVAAVFILVLGSAGGQLAARVVSTSTESSGLPGSNHLAPGTHPVVEPTLRVVAGFADVPLADKRSLIPGLLKAFGEESQALGARLIVIDNAVVVHVLTGQDRRTARRAQRGGDKGVFEKDTLRRQSIHVRSLEERIEKPDGVVALVIHEYEDHVARFIRPIRPIG